MKILATLKKSFKRLTCCTIFILASTSIFAQTATDAYTTVGAHTWTVPNGVTSITIEAWGAGGGGGGVYSGTFGSEVRASGGGGGAFSSVTISVTPGDVLDMTVGSGGNGGAPEANGTQGGASSITILGTTVCSAAGGQGGRFHRGNGNSGSGSNAGGSTGIGYLFGGGNGGSTGGANGKGGGGAAGTTAAGTNGTDTAAGQGGAVGGGNGGIPQTTNNNGDAGNAPGGGGGGAKQEAGSLLFWEPAKVANGGAGARGEVRITYCVPPSAPVEIVGLTTPCTESTNTYTVAQDVYATSYTWILPSGWSGTSTTNEIDITLDQNGGQIAVVANGACGTSNQQVLDIIPSTVPSQPIEISGESNPCESTLQNYSVDEDPNATSYVWTLPSNWNGTSTSNTIGVMTGGASGIITVEAVNQCGASVPQSLHISTTPLPVQPSPIVGNAVLCVGNSLTYSVTNDPSVDTYVWTLPSNWTGSSTTNSIVVTGGSASGTITVATQNTCGNSPVRVLNVSSLAIPAQPSVITGDATLCQGTTSTYQVTIDPSVTYTWSLPADWSGTSTTNSISITTGEASGSVTVAATNQCGASVAQTLAVVVNLISDEVTLSGSTLTATQTGAVYQWINCATGAPIPGGTQQSYTPSQEGDYKVLIFTPDNCSAESACVTVGGLSIDKNALEPVSIFPNPATHNVTISNLTAGSKITMMDMTGKVIYTAPSTNSIENIDLFDVNAGVYLLNIENKSGTTTQKLVVKK